MHQLVHHPRTGELTLEEVPPPALRRGGVLVDTRASAVSVGTELGKVELGEKSLLGKARARPDLVRKVVRSVKREGVVSTARAVRSRLDEWSPLGYSAAGVVLEVGDGVTDLRPGERVALAGAGYANHAGVDFAPRNLAAPLPDGVGFDEAAFATLSAIALHAVRLARIGVGERVGVVGLGVVGQLAGQIAGASGCRVLGIDPDAFRCELAEGTSVDRAVVLGRDDPGEAAMTFSDGRGLDAILICAATGSSEPVELAGDITRSRGRVVVVGDVGMEVPRSTYYEKELELVVSRSYGPGRYDPSYEEEGLDYPFDQVRWTEGRNLTAVLELMADGELDVAPLITHRFPFRRAPEAYELAREGDEPYLGLLLEYEEDEAEDGPIVVSRAPTAATSTADRAEVAAELGVAFVGAGGYATRHLLPALRDRDDVALTGVVTGSGLSAREAAERYGFGYCASDIDELLDDAGTDAVFVATRHSSHAVLVRRGLEAGRHVFVEKPLALDRDELTAVADAFAAANTERSTGLMVGLNRRFSPLVRRLRDEIRGPDPLEMLYRVNAGPVEEDAWYRMASEGGGMLLGEMCHFLDLMQDLCGAAPVEVSARSVRTGSERHQPSDNVAVTVSFADGSLGTLVYSTLGDGAAPKERLEVFGGGVTAVLDDYRKLSLHRDGGTSTKRSWTRDMGREAMLAATVEGFRTQRRGPVPFAELAAGMEMAFAAREALRSGRPVRLEAPAAAGEASG